MQKRRGCGTVGGVEKRLSCQPLEQTLWGANTNMKSWGGGGERYVKKKMVKGCSAWRLANGGGLDGGGGQETKDG